MNKRKTCRERVPREQEQEHEQEQVEESVSSEPEQEQLSSQSSADWTIAEEVVRYWHDRYCEERARRWELEASLERWLASRHTYDA